MYNSCGLIPARFLTLVAHSIICTVLIWNHQESVSACLSEALAEITEEISDSQHTQWLTGLSLMIMFSCFEMIAFVCGLTMFDGNSALLSIGGHSSACVFLTGLELHSWQCEWFWWIFTLGSVVPFVHDLIVVGDILINRKY